MAELMNRSTFSWSRHYLEVSGELHAPTALLPGKEPLVPIRYELGGPQSRYWRCGEEKILDHTGTRTLTPRSFTPYPVAIPTRLITTIIIKYPNQECRIFHLFVSVLGFWDRDGATLSPPNINIYSTSEKVFIMKDYKKKWWFCCWLDRDKLLCSIRLTVRSNTNYRPVSISRLRRKG
jgi:hypothetical protein